MGNSYRIQLKSIGESEVHVVKAVREITGLDLRSSKRLVERLGVVVEGVDHPAAGRIKSKLESAGATVSIEPAEASEPENVQSFVVQGKLSDTDGEGVEGAQVELLARRLRRVAVLDSARTENDGGFRLAHAAGAVPVVVRVLNEQGETVVESETQFRPDHMLRVDLVADTDELHPSGYERGSRALATVLDAASIDDLSEDELEFAQASTGLERSDLEARRVAGALQRHVQVDAGLLYGLARTRGIKTMEELADLSPAGVSEAIEEAARDGHIRSATDAQLVELRARIHAARTARARRERKSWPRRTAAVRLEADSRSMRGHTVRLIDVNDGNRALESFTVDSDGTARIDFPVPGHEGARTYRLEVFDNKGRKVASGEHRLTDGGEVALSLPARESRGPLLFDLQVVLGDRLSDESRTALEDAGIRSVADLRSRPDPGPLESVDDGLRRTLRSHASFSTIPVPVAEVQGLIETGFAEPADIVKVPLARFLGRTADLLDAHRAREVYFAAGAQSHILGELAAEGLVQPDTPFREGLESGLSEIDLIRSCACRDCESALSPAAYLLDLVKFCERHLSIGGSPPTLQSLSELLRQPLARLGTSCSAVEEEVRQCRLAIEALRADQDLNGILVPDPQAQTYLEITYRAVLAECGTSPDEIRSVASSSDGAGALAVRLGIEESRLEELALVPSLHPLTERALTEVTLERLFGIPATLAMRVESGVPVYFRPDPLREGSEPALVQWRRERLAHRWRESDEEARAGGALPLVDPARMEYGWLRTAALRRMWSDRFREFENQRRELETIRGNASTESGAVDDILTQAGLPVANLETLARRRSEGHGVTQELAELHLTDAGLSRVLSIRNQAAQGPLDEPSWEHLYDLAGYVRCRLELYPRWRQEESDQSLTLGPETFQDPGAFDLSDIDRESLPEGALRDSGQDWLDTLRTRSEQWALAGTGVASAAAKAEAAALPVLRDALIELAAAEDETIADKGDWLTDRYFIDFRESGCRTTTRVAQAIESLQGLVFAVRAGLDVEMPEDVELRQGEVFDVQWQWYGSYEAWKGAAALRLYPENFALPAVRRENSSAFQALVSSVRSVHGSVEEAVIQYQEYAADIAQLSGEAACLCGDAVVVIARSRRSWRVYWTVLEGDERNSIRRPWAVLPRLEDIARQVVGVVPVKRGDDYEMTAVVRTNQEPHQLLVLSGPVDSEQGWRRGSLPLDEIAKGPGDLLLAQTSGPLNPNDSIEVWARKGLKVYQRTFAVDGLAWDEDWTTSFDAEQDWPESDGTGDWEVSVSGARLDRLEAVLLGNGGRILVTRNSRDLTALTQVSFGWVFSFSTAAVRELDEIGAWGPDSLVPEVADELGLSAPDEAYDPEEPARYLGTVHRRGHWQLLFESNSALWRVDLERDKDALDRAFRDAVEDAGIAALPVGVLLGLLYVGRSPWRQSGPLEAVDRLHLPPVSGRGEALPYGAAYREGWLSFWAIALGRYAVEEDGGDAFAPGALFTPAANLAPERRDGASPAGSTCYRAQAGDPARSYLDEAALFFPLHLGLTYQTRRSFDRALDWYRAVYDYAASPGRKRSPALRASLADDHAGAVIRLLGRYPDPLDPHEIARVRPGTYSRLAALAVARCLIDYADAEFSRDTGESLARARALYEEGRSVLLEESLLSAQNCEQRVATVLALIEDELSPAYPVASALVIRRLQDSARTRSASEIEAFCEAIKDVVAAQDDAPDRIERLLTIDLETSTAGEASVADRHADDDAARSAARGYLLRLPQVVNAVAAYADTWVNAVPATALFGDGHAIGHGMSASGGRIDTTFAWPVGGFHLPSASPSFCLRPNPAVAGLEARVEAQLRKLRLCLNIDGLPRPIEPYAAPIDVESVLSFAPGERRRMSRLAFQPTAYRYRVLLDRARQLTALAQQIEASYLAALEQQQAKEYELLRARQELDVARARVRLQDLRVQEAVGGVGLARLQRDRSGYMEEHFDDLIQAGPTQNEENALKYMRTAATLNDIATGFHTAAVAASIARAFVPGGKDFLNPGATASAAAAALGSQASAASVRAQIASTSAAQERREQDWALQRGLANADGHIGEAQIALARNRVTISRQERTVAALGAEHAAEVAEFLARRFLNEELYAWMANTLGDIYAYFLQQAAAVARLAQYQLSFERQESVPLIIADDYWRAEPDAPDRAGLTGSARLLRDVGELDRYAFDSERRKLHLTKTISLARLDPVAFEKFRRTGNLRFNTASTLFDNDHPGHYLRLIRSVRSSVVALIPPVDGIKAALSTTGLSRVVVRGDTFSEVRLRRDPESVALSSPQDDSGVFDLDPKPELLRPFEGMGVDAYWEFRLPRDANAFDFGTVADVLVTFQYTALESPVYRSEVLERLGRSSTGERAFSFRYEFADAWYDLHNPELTDTPLSVAFETRTADFPPNVEKPGIKGVTLYFPDSGGEPLPLQQVELQFVPEGEQQPRGGSASLVDGIASIRRGNASPWLDMLGKPVVGEWRLSLPDTADARGLFKDERIADILLVVAYEGERPSGQEA